jgi:hypothetical protein
MEEAKMDLIQMLNGMVALISELQAKLADTQAALDEQIKIAYDKGYNDGVASIPVPVPSDKIYSQEELDAAIAVAMEPLVAKIAELDAVVAGIDQKVADAVIAMKLELAVKFQELKAKEDGIEVEFEELLK